MTEASRQITSLRRRRGVCKSAITKVTRSLDDLRQSTDIAHTAVRARQILKRIETQDGIFHERHDDVIKMLESEEDLDREQEILEIHEEEVARITADFEKVIADCPTVVDQAVRKSISRKVDYIASEMSELRETIWGLSEEEPDTSLIHHQESQLKDLKSELKDLTTSMLDLDLDREDELMVAQKRIKGAISDCLLKLTRLLTLTPTAPSLRPPRENPGIKLPKLDVPMFDGSLLKWQSFWEQFRIAVHDRTTISDAEKLVYLQQSLKGGSAKNAIEGLSRTGDNYGAAIETLKSRYDQPRLIHRGHVTNIMEAPTLKGTNGHELRMLHDVLQQNLRALKSMGKDPSGTFITSIIETKLDPNTLYEWQKHSHDSVEVPHYNEILKFLNVRAQTLEVTSLKSPKEDVHPTRRNLTSIKKTASFATGMYENESPPCVCCKTEKHPLYSCSRFKNASHDRKMSLVKENKMCLNCLRPGHFAKFCRSQHKCRKCQRAHHTLLHVETSTTTAPVEPDVEVIPTHTTIGLSDTLLMTCQIEVSSPSGEKVKARALLDSASSASFISERLAKSLSLPRSPCSTRITGVAGLMHKSPLQSVTTFNVKSTRHDEPRFDVTAVITPQVTCELPIRSLQLNRSWRHLEGIPMADPSFGKRGKIDVLLGVDIFVACILNGRRTGPPNSPVAFETTFGWVLGGRVDSSQSIASQISSNHTSLLTGDDLLRQFWKIEDESKEEAVYSPDEQLVVQHFNDNHVISESGRFQVSLPRKPDAKQLGESRSQALRRFLTLEKSLHYKGQFRELAKVIQEYMDMRHAEIVPVMDLEKPPQKVFYLPIQVVRKETSTTTKVRAVFDASAKTSSGISLNDTLMVGPTVHPQLVDVLMRFRQHRIALVADVSRMYRAVELTESDKDYHRFLWREDPKEPIADYRMRRLTFGVASSSFIANMTILQNATNRACTYPLAAKIVKESFYVDDALTGADTPEEAVKTQKQLHQLFNDGGFILRKWNSNDLSTLEHVSPELKDEAALRPMPSEENYTKTLGMVWNSTQDYYKLTISELQSPNPMTKRALISQIAKTYDVLGWYAPVIVKVKVLFQNLWEMGVSWDEVVPPSVMGTWIRWKEELPLLTNRHISRCYYPKESRVISSQLHGFSDASEVAYAGVVYLRMEDSEDKVHVALVASKTKVAPIKKLTIPRLELCGARLLAKLLRHVRQVLDIPEDKTYAWTDSTIVLAWLDGNPRRFKTYVGNRIANIIELIPSKHWNHVRGKENPADSASRGLFPAELVDHQLWWEGPEWLHCSPTEWPAQSSLQAGDSLGEERELSFTTILLHRNPLLPLDKISSFTRMKRIVAWVMRFIRNCQVKDKANIPHLTVSELKQAETYWLKYSQQDNFSEEIAHLAKEESLSKSSCLLSLHPFVGPHGLLRVGGREANSNRPFNSKHPAILHGSHPITRMIVREEHLHLLHAGPSLLTSHLNRNYHIIGCQRTVRSITRACIICRRLSTKPQPQVMGQLPLERVTPHQVFSVVGVDFAGPILTKYGHVRKPTVLKSYVCVFVSLSVKAVHLEAVSDLTTEAFIAALRRFVSRRGKPSTIFSDHGTNFVGANRELRNLYSFLQDQSKQTVLADFCASLGVNWKFIPERAPHFGGIWEAAVKSFKTHFRKITSNTKLSFEELTTVLTQIEAVLNSRPLIPLSNSEEALTPGHFLIGKSMTSLPDSEKSQSMSLPRRWHLCQNITNQFWKKWSDDYLTTLRRFPKWHNARENIKPGDIVVLCEDLLIPTKWPLARILEVHPGSDGIVRVVTLKTENGIYKRPITKVAPLLASETEN